ncbi:hypothetical protein BGZ54_007293 [Gamsiella multidivaricata]|nr:hypothetical protein BGZ54_007293 [Gamsiella multidivaricata]
MPLTSVISTVTVLNGTIMTVTAVITIGQTGQPATQQAIPATSTLPKAPQSILVVQSTSYGKILPAAGPPNDQIESHFWDQFVPSPQGKKKSLSTETSQAWTFTIGSVVCSLLIALEMIRL